MLLVVVECHIRVRSPNGAGPMVVVMVVVCFSYFSVHTISNGVLQP